VDEEFERETLTHYFTRQFDDLLSKIEGLPEYDARRPMTATGTNLLGLIQHTGAVVLGYARLPWGRDLGRELMWEDTDEEPDIDLRVLPDVSRDEVLQLAADARAAMVELLAGPLAATGEVPWWGPNGNVTVHRVAVHVIAEIARHAGHADILRELIDGQAGMRQGDPNIPPLTAEARAERANRIESDAKRYLTRS
jgi:Protein of unknown function (DUF664)